MKRLLTLVAFFATIQASAQQVNPVPDYVFRNQMSVGRGTVTDTAAYFSIGPRYGANKGFMPPIVGDTATFSSGKRNGLLIFSVQKNKFLYWDSVRVQWSDMAGSSGSYITGSGIAGYLPQFSASTILDTSALFTIGNRLGIGTSTFAYNSTNTANIELNGTAGGILGFKRNDSARGYLWHTGDNMELANTVAGSISFNTNSATRGSISSAGVWRLHNLAGTGDRVVVASSNGTLSASTSVTGLVDTTTISTRAWRQKGIDSLVSIIPAAGVGGSGTTNYVPKFTAGSTIGNSLIYDNGSSIGIGSTAGSYYVEARKNGTADIVANSTADNNSAVLSVFNSGGTSGNFAQLRAYGNTTSSTLFGSSTNKMITLFSNSDALMTIGTISGTPLILGTNNTERLRIHANGRIGINTTTDAGYQLDINGTLRSVNGANFATTSGNVGIGTASPGVKLDVTGDVRASGSLVIGTGGSTEQGAIFSNANFGFWFKSRQASPVVAHYQFGDNSGNSLAMINPGGELLINTTSDAGDYKLQVSGNIYNTGSAVLAATSGNVGVGTASPGAKLLVNTSGSEHVALGSLSSIPTGRTMILQTSTTGGTIETYQSTTASYLNTYINPNGGELNIATTTDAGDYKLQVAGNIYGSGLAVIGNAIINTNSPFVTGANIYTNGQSLALGTQGANLMSFFTNNTERGRINSAGEWIIDASGTDAGDYKLQVVGNARVGTGKLDIVTNTAFGLSVSRSGTDVVAQQINNSTGILYYGAESSTGGALFTGSSAYAAVIGSGAAYPLQFATDNVTRATINTNGELLINTLTDNGDFKLQVNGSALISGSIQTANPVSGTAVPWRLGSVVATNVQLDTANYVEVNINGTFYRLAIVTPL